MFRNIHKGLISFSRSMAGHSKWANIKHIKGAKDAERAILFQKLSRNMKAVIKEQGSADPKSNLKLAHLIEQARTHNMPVEKIQQILRVDYSKDESKQYILEVRGPGGCIFVLEVLTTSLMKTKQGINTINRKCNGSWADGISNHLFNKKGQIKVVPLIQGQTLEQALDHAIEIGAEDVTAVEEDGNFCFTSSSTDFYRVHSALKHLGYKTLESDLRYFPISRVSLNEVDMVAAAKLYEKLKQEPDVVEIHDNIE